MGLKETEIEFDGLGEIDVDGDKVVFEIEGDGETEGSKEIDIELDSEIEGNFDGCFEGSKGDCDKSFSLPTS